jgi:hypothetical protein
VSGPLAFFGIHEAAAGTAVPAACSGNMLDLAESASAVPSGAMPWCAEARGFLPHLPLGEAATGAANIKHVFDSRDALEGCQLPFASRSGD